MTSFGSYSKSNIIQGESTLSSSKKVNGRFADILSWFPAASGGAQYQAMLLNALKTGFNFTHIFRSNVAINHDAGIGTANQVLQSDGDGTTSWATVSPLTDGDKGDIVVSAGGTTFTVDTNAINAGKIAADAVTTVKILDSNVTAAKLASNAVTTVKITDANVTTAKIADANVTLAKLQNLTGPSVIGKDTGTGAPISVTVGNHLAVSSSTLTVKGTRTAFSSYSHASSGARQLVSNTVTETSIINGFSISNVDPGGASWPTIAANTLVQGSTFRIKAIGTYTTASTPTMRAKVKLGTALVLDTGAIATVASGGAGLIEIEGIFTVVSSTTSVGNIVIRVTDLSTKATYNLTTAGNGVVTIDTTSAQTFDFTFQWGTASASNSAEFTNIVIERIY